MANRKKERMEMVHITPSMARRWLEANEGNRNLRTREIAKYAKDIERGSFHRTHEAIAFDVKGRMIDGQHRLYAIVASGKAVKLWVGFDFPEKTQLFIDQGCKRSLADAAKFYVGETLNRKSEAVAKAMMDPKIRSVHTRIDQLNFYQKHQDAIEYAVAAFSGCTRRAQKSQVVAVVARAYYTQDRQRLQQFVNVLKDGMITSPSDRAAIQLRDHLLSLDSGPAGRRWLYARAEYLLERFLKRRAGSRVHAKVATEEMFLIPGEAGYEQQLAA